VHFAHILLPQGKLKLLFKSPKPSGHQEHASVPETVHQRLKKAGLKAVVKAKKPLSKASRGSSWILQLLTKIGSGGLKHVVRSDETKIICLGQMGGVGLGKTWESLNDRLVEGTLKFGGGSVMPLGCMSGRGLVCMQN